MGKTKKVRKMSIDLTIIAIVFALILILIFFSAVILYLSFRIKETFRKETRKGATIAKTAFLIGTLFMAGGIFYFAANTLTNINQPNPTTTPFPSASPSPENTQSPSPTNSPIPTANPTPTPTTTAQLTPSTSPSSSPSTAPKLSVAYPPTAKMNSIITVTITIINPATNTLHSASIETNLLFQEFALQSSTSTVVGNVISIGDLPTGTTIVSLTLQTQNKPRDVIDTLSLVYQEMTDQITQQISISIRAN